MSEAKKDPVERLAGLLGFDPAKPDTGDSGVLAEAMAEVKKERAEAAKKKATELIRTAIELRSKFDAVEKKFNEEKARFNKELGKVINRIEAMAKGQAPPADEPPPIPAD